MFNKFFGKKNDGFYMQVDESAPPKAVVATKETVAAKPKVAETKVSETKAGAATETASQPVDITPATVATIASENPTEKKAEQKAKSAKTSIKDKKDKKEDKKSEKPEKSAAQPEVIAAAPVAAAFTNFATDYLVTPAVAGNRRRPGANMKGFMSMARDVKEMKKGSQGNQQKAKAAKKTEA
jgi:hypothetical protein